MSQILLGLRSNASWFAGPRTREMLEGQLKRAFALYDTVCLQDGTYVATVGESASSWMMYPPGTIDRSADFYREVRGRWQVALQPEGEGGPGVRLIDDRVVAYYRADFLPVLEAAGLGSTDFVEWMSVELEDAPLTSVKQAAKQHLRNPDMVRTLPEGARLREEIVAGAHHDAMLGTLLGTPILVDPNCRTLIELQSMAGAERWTADGRGEIHSVSTLFGVPDFSKLSWDQVAAVRESAAGRDFRRLLDDHSAAVTEAMMAGEPEAEIRALVTRFLATELRDELGRQVPGRASIALGVVANLIPYLGLLGSAAETAALARHNRTWISLAQ